MARHPNNKDSKTQFNAVLKEPALQKKGLLIMPRLRLFIFGIASFWLLSLLLLSKLHGAELLAQAEPGATAEPAAIDNQPTTAEATVLNPGSEDSVKDSPEYSPMNPDRYQGPLKQTDVRVGAVRASLAQSQLPPAKLRLIFGHQKGDFLYFYDLEGHSIKINYRRSKFDRPNIQKYKVLIPGIAYEIDIQFKGLEDKGQLYPLTDTGTVSQDVAGRAKNPRSVLVFKISSFKILRLDSIRF